LYVKYCSREAVVPKTVLGMRTVDAKAMGRRRDVLGRSIAGEGMGSRIGGLGRWVRGDG
jgi:hypothetical protein